ncbi:unnamed protein product [Trypanosoma congolense IL3000]|uniref:WGS project CAEQ00000000 data, annotated contig 1089 n=1 Tax=Trypanosoma congolense (strain IL3000) TaxID=1068625 RepID=F9W3Q1_TRYCI|nr:unnamed protein product [Trypanosoma congolense IL3000]
MVKRWLPQTTGNGQTLLHSGELSRSCVVRPLFGYVPLNFSNGYRSPATVTPNKALGSRSFLERGPPAQWASLCSNSFFLDQAQDSLWDRLLPPADLQTWGRVRCIPRGTQLQYCGAVEFCLWFPPKLLPACVCVGVVDFGTLQKLKAEYFDFRLQVYTKLMPSWCQLFLLLLLSG